MLPDPALSFTIPSIHDGISLDCRIYHPRSLSANPRAPRWERHAAVFAHPYAPLGGCYDDPVVAEVGSVLLRSGFLLMTFNFRGAGGSAGRTSWTAKPEKEDYMSVVGFLVYYIHYLDPFRHQSASPEDEIPRSDPSGQMPRTTRHPNLLMGGYSYGSIIASQLPPLESILNHFSAPKSDSPAAQIRLRAQHLAAQQNDYLGSARAAMLEHGAKGHGASRIRIGGSEDMGSPRRSRSNNSRSLSMEADRMRKSLHEVFERHQRGRSGSRHRNSSRGPPTGHVREDVQAELTAGGAADDALEERISPLAELLIPRPSYVLVSPIQGFVKHLAAMSFGSTSSHGSSHGNDQAAKQKMVTNPTLVVYGDRDGFVAVSKSRAWASQMRQNIVLQGSEIASLFRAKEVTSAGHFWVEIGVMMELKLAVGEFASQLYATENAAVSTGTPTSFGPEGFE